MPESRSAAGLRVTLGQTLRHFRQERGLTQEVLASRARLHPTYISLLENGRKSPTVDVLYRIARVLDVPVSAILGRAEAPQPAGKSDA